MRLSGCAGQSGSLTEASQGDCSSEEVVSNGLVPDGGEHLSHAGQVSQTHQTSGCTYL